MKILITGGTGFIGRSIVRKLLQKNHEVFVFSRNPPLNISFKEGSPRFFKGDICNEESLAMAMSGMDGVINCVQFPSHPVENPKKGWTYWGVDALGTERQVRAAKRAGVQIFLYLSGTGAGQGRTEPWFRAKDYAEGVLLKSGLKCVIFRPSWVYGKEDRSLNRFVSMIRYFPILPMIGAGKNRVRPLWVEDLATLATLCLDDAVEKPLVLEVGGPKEMTFRKVLQTLCKILNKNPLLLPIPKPLVKMAAHLLQFLPPPLLTPGAVDFLTMDILIQTEKMTQLFPEFHPLPLEEALPSYVTRS